MTCTIASESLQNDLISWSATYAVDGQYSAQIELQNNSFAYDQDLVGSAVQIPLTLTGETFGCTNDAVNWVNGIISSVDVKNDASSERQATLQVVSYAARLNEKPINTYQFYNNDLNTILEEIFTIFGGLPLGFLNMDSAYPSTIEGVAVMGSNLLSEAKELAKAFGTDLYVNRDGILTAKTHITNATSTHFDIPKVAVLSAEMSTDTGLQHSRLKVRGRFLGGFEEPETGQATNPKDNKGTPPTGPDNELAAGTMCFNQAADRRQAVANVNMKIGDFLEKGGPAAAAQVTLTGSHTLENSQVVTPVTTEMTVGTTSNAAENFPAETKVEVPFTVVAPGLTKRDSHGIAAVDARNHEAHNKMHRKFRAIANNLKKGGKGGKGGGSKPMGGNDGPGTLTRMADEGHEQFVECTRDDSFLKSIFGVRIEQVQNTYIQTIDLACQYALRLFFESKIRRKQWRVETAFLPCIDVNKVVTFYPPNSNTQIRGRVSELVVKYESGPKVTMSMVVQSFEDV